MITDDIEITEIKQKPIIFKTNLKNLIEKSNSIL